jgi:hypothetical protein
LILLNGIDRRELPLLSMNINNPAAAKSAADSRVVSLSGPVLNRGQQM